MAEDICPHLDSIGEVTKEDLLQKSKVGFSFIHYKYVKDAQSRSLAECAMAYTPLKVITCSALTLPRDLEYILSLLCVYREKHHWFSPIHLLDKMLNRGPDSLWSLKIL